MNQGRAFLFTVAAMVLLLLLSLQPARASTWTTSEVDNASSSDTGKYCSMAVDGNGKLHIGYLDSGSSVLRYATNKSGSWALERLDSASNPTEIPNVASSGTATVYTPDGPRVMAYSQLTTGPNKYKKYSAVKKSIAANNTWVFQDIAGVTNYPTINSISTTTVTGALQYQNYTHITFSDGNTLWYANERDMYYYQFEANTGTYSALAIDPAGHPHIVYYNSGGNLKYATNPTALSSGFQTYQIETGGTYPSIVADASNMLHVTYVNGGHVWYINRLTTSDPVTGWSSPYDLGACGTGGGYTSMAVDDVGTLHIAFYDNTGTGTGVLRYIERSAAGTWSSEETVSDANNSTNYGQYAALVVDQYHNVDIAYYDATRTSLKVATKSAPVISASPSPANFGTVAIGNSSTQTVTVSNKGNVILHINTGAVSVSGTDASQFSITNNGCNGVSLTTGSSCNVTLAFSPTSAGSKAAALHILSDDPIVPDKAVALQGTTDCGITHTITTNPGVGGAISPLGAVTVCNGASQTFTITADTGFNISGEYVDNPGHTSSIGTGATYTFNNVTADHTLDATFTPVISSTSTWSSAEIDNTSGSNTGKYCSIAADDSGWLHIGYLDTSAATPLLRYVNNVGGSWSTPESVPLPNMLNAGLSTVYTPYGPRIMGYTYNGTSYKYQSIRKVSGSWQIQDIAGGYYDPPANTQPTPPMANIAIPTDTFTGAVQFGGYTFITYSDGNTLWYANERDYYYYQFPGTTSTSGNQSDLGVDSAGHIHIVYYNPGAGGKLMYGTNNGNTQATFQSTQVLTGGASFPTIAVDEYDRLHVAYVSGGNIMYITKLATDSTWSSPVQIGTCGSQGGFLSMKANGLGIVHLSFYSKSGNTGTMMYAQRTTDGNWSIPQAVPDVNSSSDYGQYAKLTVDQNHNVNVAYYDAIRTSLKVATKLIPVTAVSPASINLGAVVPGTQSSPYTVAVTNAGHSNLTMGHVVLTGTNAARFSITSNGCTPGLILNPGAGCNISVIFAPTALGSQTASLNIPTNDPYVPDKLVGLAGTGVGALHTITATAGSGGTVNPSGAVSVADGADQTFTITPLPGFSIGSVTASCPSFTQDDSTHFTCHSVTADYSFQASFVSNIEVSLIYFGTLQSAYDAAADGVPMKARAVTFSESLTCNMAKNVIFAGGYDSVFGSQSGTSVIAGTIGINAGGIEAQNIGLQ